tara:strand:- start:4083 stop:4919 length:837 start_codon:yes stop_codon:yes gene_type:complete
MAKLVENLPMEEYHGNKDIISKSMLSDYLDCPLKYKYFHIEGGQKKTTPAMNIGSAVHTLALEPDLFHESYYILPADVRRDKRSKAYQEHLDKAQERTIIREQELVDIQNMAKALSENKKAVTLLKASGFIEASIYWKDEQTGLDLRCRPDFLRSDGVVIDLKVTNSAEPFKFMKTAYDLCYDVSAAMTAFGYEALYGEPLKEYIFLCIEPKAPHIIEAYSTLQEFDEDLTYMRVGQERLDRALTGLADSMKRDYWPSYASKIQPLAVPQYELNKMER